MTILFGEGGSFSSQEATQQEKTEIKKQQKY
jgi:hypothetical protein